MGEQGQGYLGTNHIWSCSYITCTVGGSVEPQKDFQLGRGVVRFGLERSFWMLGAEQTEESKLRGKRVDRGADARRVVASTNIHL